MLIDHSDFRSASSVGEGRSGRVIRRVSWTRQEKRASSASIRFSRGCPYRATDARQVVGAACRPVGSLAVIA